MFSQEMVSAMFGVVLIVTAFIVGIIIGAFSIWAKKEKIIKKWVEKNGCYLCQEKIDYCEDDA